MYQQQLQALSDQVAAHLTEEAKLDIQKTVKEHARVNAEASADLKKQILDRKLPPKGKSGVIKSLGKNPTDKQKAAADTIAKAASIKAAADQKLKDAAINVG